MEKNIKFLAEENGVKFYEYSFNGNIIHIIKKSNKEIVFQAEKTILNQFFKSEEYQQVCNYYDITNI